jgi:hypothetical protein
MTVDQLYEFVENAVVDETNRQKIALLLEAMNDWPIEVQTTDAFFTEVKNFLKIDALTYQAVEAKMEGLDREGSAWQLEALTSLVQIEHQDNSDSIDVVIATVLGE